jgi:peptidoglycan/LPS O-acetylase OafA/YrhL
MHRSYIPGLDGLRGVAALMVFVVHVWSKAGYPEVQIRLFSTFDIRLGNFLGYGEKGVLLFFCLSGFLLSLPFWAAFENPDHPVDLLDYFRKRFYRVYPAYFVAVIVYLLFLGGKNHFLIESIFFISHIALIHNFYEALVYQISVPMWSVATEFQMYILLPAIFFIAGKLKKTIRKDLLMPFLLYISAGLIGMAFLAMVTYVSSNYSVPASIMNLNGGLIKTSPLVGLTHFCWGVLCAYLYLRIARKSAQPNARFDVAAVVTLLAIGIVALFDLDRRLGYPPIGWPGAPVLFGLLILFVSLSRTKYGAAALLEWKPVKFFGIISYSFFLYHDLVLRKVFAGLPDFFPDAFAANLLSKGAFAFTITLLISWFSYRLVEKRLTAWLKRVLVRKTGSITTPQIWTLHVETQEPVTRAKSE